MYTYNFKCYIKNMNKKMILIFPPQWTPISPHYGLMSLMGQLKSNGFNADFMDLNLEFYNKILTKEYLDSINEKIKNDYLPLFCHIMQKVNYCIFTHII